MKKQTKEHRDRVDCPQTGTNTERRKEERRKQECEGYCYIEMVGWMDRRECERRHDSGADE